MQIIFKNKYYEINDYYMISILR